MPATMVHCRSAGLNLLQLPDEILNIIVQFTFDHPAPIEDHVTYVPWLVKTTCDNQTLLRLPLTHSRLSAIARSWLIRRIHFGTDPGVLATRAYAERTLQRYKSFEDYLNNDPRMIDQVECAFLEEPIRRENGHFWTLGATWGTSFNSAYYQTLKYLAVDIEIGDDNDDYVGNEWANLLDSDAAEGYGHDQNGKERGDENNADFGSSSFTTQVRTFKYFVSEGALPLRLFKILLSGARHLNSICLHFRSLGKLAVLKTLIQIVKTHAKQLMHLSLEAILLKRPGQLEALQYHYMDRLKTLSTSAPLILGPTETDDSRRPLYDMYMYKRLPHNLEELHLTFNSVLGFVRNVHETFREVLYGKCACIYTEQYHQELGVKSRTCLELTRETNFREQ